MSKRESAKMSGVGLDVGTSRIVVARKGEDGYDFQSQLNAFVGVPFSRMTQNVLQKEKVPHVVKDGDLLVFGNEAETFANMFSRETRRPMRNGLLNPDEPGGLDLIKHILVTLAGPARQEGEKICFSVPAPRLSSEETPSYHQAALRQTIEELGYEAESVEEGLAVIYSELESTNYTGIGISCGGGMCNVCCAYLSVPVFSYSITKAGDYVDESAGAATGELATHVRSVKEEEFRFGPQDGKVLQAIQVYYQDVIDGLIGSMEEAFSKAKKVPRIKKPVPVVVSGGTALPQGFLDQFRKSFEGKKLPIPVSEIRLSEHPLNATAKGALVATLSGA